METLEVGPFEFHDKIPLKRKLAEKAAADAAAKAAAQAAKK